MPFPLLALAFGGLLAGRELGARADRRAITAKEQADAQAFSDALAKFSGQGQLSTLDGYGPPTPVGVGQTDLDPRTIRMTQALAIADPEAAFNLAISERDKAFKQTNSDRTAQHQTNVLDAQIDRYDLDVRKQDQVDRAFAAARSDMDFGRRQTQSELDATAARMNNPRAAVEWAATNGKTHAAFNVAGETQIVPIKGTAEFTTAEDSMRRNTDTLEDLGQLRDIVATAGPGGLISPESPLAAYSASKRTSILLAMKEAFELGAISESDMSIMNALLGGDPASVSQLVTSNPGAVEASLASVSEGLLSSAFAGMRKTANWLGTNQGLRSRTIQAAADTQARNIATRGNLEALQSAAAAPQQAGEPTLLSSLQAAGAQLGNVGLVPGLIQRITGPNTEGVAKNVTGQVMNSPAAILGAITGAIGAKALTK